MEQLESSPAPDHDPLHFRQFILLCSTRRTSLFTTTTGSDTFLLILPLRLDIPLDTAHCYTRVSEG